MSPEVAEFLAAIGGGGQVVGNPGGGATPNYGPKVVGMAPQAELDYRNLMDALERERRRKTDLAELLPQQQQSMTDFAQKMSGSAISKMELAAIKAMLMSEGR